MTLPIEDPDFWRTRLENAKQRGPDMVYKSIYDTSYENWKEIHHHHSYLLTRIIRPGDRVLDAGCGFGALLECMPNTDYTYHGLDLSPDLIALARERYPDHSFAVGNLRSMPEFKDKQFTVAICRSVDGMVKDNLGYGAWREMERELFRVADRLVLMSYGAPSVCQVLDTTDEPGVHTLNSVEMAGGKLTYRYGSGATCEITDLIVVEAERRKGIATKLVKALIESHFGGLYAFTRETNVAAQALYTKLGFHGSRVPELYRGMDGMLYVRQCRHSSKD